MPIGLIGRCTFARLSSSSISSWYATSAPRPQGSGQCGATRPAWASWCPEGPGCSTSHWRISWRRGSWLSTSTSRGAAVIGASSPRPDCPSSVSLDTTFATVTSLPNVLSMSWCIQRVDEWAIGAIPRYQEGRIADVGSAESLERLRRPVVSVALRFVQRLLALEPGRHRRRASRHHLAVSYTHLRAHETGRNLVCRL